MEQEELKWMLESQIIPRLEVRKYNLTSMWINWFKSSPWFARE